MDAQSIAIHEGCVDKRPRALSYSHTLPEQGQLATYKRVISSEKIDRGLPLSDSCVCVREREREYVYKCVTHVLYNHWKDECGCLYFILPIFSISMDI